MSEDPRPTLVRDPWSRLRAHTPARIGLGRAGVSLPTEAMLAFQWAHAQARDAVHTPLDVEALGAQLQAQGHRVLNASSAAPDRPTYLQRPDLGRQLSAASQARLRAEAAPPVDEPASFPDLAVAIVDGLSALAVQRHAAPLLAALTERLAASPQAWRIAPVTVVTQGRVAVGDDVGELLRARVVVVFIGERPGLSSPDSLGVYLTWAPQRGRVDSERNCVSNVRPEGLSIAEAAHRLGYLLDAARAGGYSGVALKDESAPLAALAGPQADPGGFPSSAPVFRLSGDGAESATG